MNRLAGVLALAGQTIVANERRPLGTMGSDHPSAVRGPDDAFMGTGALLATSRDGRAVVFAGGLENRRELRSALAGTVPHLASDADIVAEAIATWGARAVDRLEGAFAFAAYDGRAGTLLLARDRFGLEPLYYSVRRNRLVFASDAAILGSQAGQRRAADLEAIAHYLVFGFAPTERSCFRDVQPLPAGHCLEASRRGSLHRWRYWSLPLPPTEGETADVRPFLAELDRLLVENVKSLDSSLIAFRGAQPAACALIRACRDFPPKQNLTIEPDHATFAQFLARHEVDLAREALDLIAIRGEPLAGVEVLEAHALLRAHGSDDRVCVSHVGGDALLLSDPRYRRLAEHLSRANALGQRPPVTALNDSSVCVRDRYADQVACCSDGELLELAGPGLVPALLFSPVDDIGVAIEQADQTNLYDLIARVDLEHGSRRTLALMETSRLMPERKVRAPFLSLAVAELCARTPQQTRLQAGKALAGRRDTASSHGLSLRGPIPLGDWLRSGLRERLLDTIVGRAFRQRDLFCLPALERRVQAVLGGDDRAASTLWAVLCLETWFEIAIDEPIERGRPGATLANIAEVSA